MGIGTVWGVLAPLCYSGANTDAAKKSSNFYKRMNPKDFEIVSDGQAPFAGASLVLAWNVLAKVACSALQGGKYYDASKAHGHGH